MFKKNLMFLPAFREGKANHREVLKADQNR